MCKWTPVHLHCHEFRPFQECWSVSVIHKFPDATPTMSTTNLKWHIINFFSNPDYPQVSTSDNLIRAPLPLLPFTPLAAPANILVSLRIQLIKVTVLDENSIYFIFSLGFLRSSSVYRYKSGRGCHTLPFFFTFFLSFHLSKFSFYINNNNNNNNNKNDRDRLGLVVSMSDY